MVNRNNLSHSFDEPVHDSVASKDHLAHGVLLGLAKCVRDITFDLDGYSVIALNVTKLRSDNVDPREYIGRLEDWQTKVEKYGGRWQVINDLDGLEGLL